MNNEHYYKIYGWMKNVYKLRGASLEVYAVLYAMTRKKEWQGTYEILAGYTDIELKTLRRAVKTLGDKGLLSIENIAYSTYTFQALHPKKAEMAEVAQTLKACAKEGQNVPTQGQNVPTQGQNVPNSKERSKENINNILNKKENNGGGGEKDVFPAAPTWEEVYEYSKSKLVSIETAKSFFCHYEATGWRLGKGGKIKKWQALLMKWDIEDRQREKEQATRAATRYQAGNQITREQAAERARQLEAERVAREQADAEYEASKNDAETQAEIAAIQERLAKKFACFGKK
ncbi:MAG: hypothetical protein MJZ92_00550 [Paludibacteraceae bacterium]|nr:hypothetical protein [Paludibacteraceae bacterium]